MDVQKELAAIEERIFDDGLYQTILHAYQEEMVELRADIGEREYRKGKAALAPSLNEAQRAMLDEAEALCEENTKYALNFSFRRGIFACFQHLFHPETQEDLYEALVSSQLLEVPGVYRYPKYDRTQDKSFWLFEELSAQLSRADREHVLSVECAWDDRIYGVLQYGFYLGYRYAFSIICPLLTPKNKMKITDKAWQVGNDLGFNCTRAELEACDPRDP